MNAVKHGLFARTDADFLIYGEDQDEYHDLLKGLWDYHEPLGRAEELEVQILATCYWKLRRGNEYENAQRRIAVSGIREQLADGAAFCDQKAKNDRHLILGLERLRDEILAAKKVPVDFRERAAAIGPELGPMGRYLEIMAREQMVGQVPPSRLGDFLRSDETSVEVAVEMITQAIGVIEDLADIRQTNMIELAYHQHSVPTSEVLDRLVRYEAATERRLAAAMSRLEQLQRRRRGQTVLPPVRPRFAV